MVHVVLVDGSVVLAALFVADVVGEIVGSEEGLVRVGTGLEIVVDVAEGGSVTVAA